MKKLLILCFLFYAGICFGQEKMGYVNFIKTDTAVKWAAIYNSYINLTPAHPDLSIRNFYLNKLKKQGVITYLEDTAAFAVTPVHRNYNGYIDAIKKVDYDHTKMNWYFNFDGKSDALRTTFEEEVNPCDTCLSINKFSFYKVKQLLYYKKNRLYIHNILLAPIIYTKTDTTARESVTYYEGADLAFNETKNDDAVIPAYAKYIGRACNDMVLWSGPGSDSAESNVLTMKNRSLSLLLYRDIKKRLIKAYDTRISIFPDPKYILDYRKIDEYQNENVLVPEYDSSGVKGYKTMLPEIYFDDIYNYTLIQDFYFDFVKEKLYSKLVAFVARRKVITSRGKFMGLTDYWGVIFPGEKKQLQRK